MEYSVLLLDDNEAILELTKCTLECNNHLKILPFSNPIQALQRVHLFGAPDLVVTDLDLPEMNGIDFLTEVTGLYPYIRAVIFTANPDTLPYKCVYPVIIKEPKAYKQLIAMVVSALKIS